MKKQCTKCHAVLSHDNFARATGKKDGLQPWCKPCRKQYVANNSMAIKVKRAAFYIANKERLQKDKKARYLANSERDNKKSREYYHSHKPQARANQRAWAAKNRELVRELSRKTYWRAPERKRLKNKSHYEKNKMQYRCRDRNRRALELRVPGTHSGEEIEDLFKKQNGKCAAFGCGCDLVTEGKGKYHIDHDIPLSIGGSNCAKNLSLLCPTCNKSKATRTMAEFTALRFFAGLAG